MKIAAAVTRTASLWTVCITIPFAPVAVGLGNGGPWQSPVTTLGGAPEGGVVADSLAGRLAMLGWTRSAGIIDALASGTLTQGGKSEKFVLKAKAGSRQRTERPESGTVVVVNNGRGYVLNKGKRTPLKLQEGIAAVPWMFPFLTPLVDPESEQIPPLSKQDSASTVYKFSKKFAVGDRLDSLRDRYQAVQIYFDKSQGWLAKVEFQLPSRQSSWQSIQVEWLLGDYRKSGPLSLPYRVEERIQGRSVWVMQFDRVDLNVGIPDQEFEVKN